MNKTNIDQALAALADALKSSEPDSFINSPKEFIKKIPHRSLSGDHLEGGKILKFASAGITDQSSTQQILVKDDGVYVSTLHINHIENLNVENTITTKTLKVDTLEVKELKAEIKVENDKSLTFSGDNIDGKGILWSGKGHVKQLIYASNPERIFLSESLDLAKGKSLHIGGIKILNEQELGSTIIKSNLREVGRLKGLIVDGSISINQYMFYDHLNDRLGIGTDQPKAVLNLIEHDVDLIFGSSENGKGKIGVFNSTGLDLITDNTPRISIESSGNILLGNKNFPPVKVSVHGTLAVNVSNPDSRVNLDIAGPIKFNNKLHLSGPTEPISGSYNVGDIVWNSEPQQRKYIGWVCVQSGSPGIWCSFGEIR